MNTTTLKELEKQYTGTYSIKDSSVRGRKEVSFYNLKVGDLVLIDNHFVEIVEEPEAAQEEKKEVENMEYDYREAMKEDVKEYIENEINLDDFASRDDLEQELNDTLFCEDSVTGNGSGSYTFNSSKAREYVIGNMDLLNDAIGEFCVTSEEIVKRFLSEDWEYFDVTIRCYLLGEAIGAALDEMEIDF